MKRLTLIVLYIGFAMVSNAQRELVSESPAADTTTETVGPNLKNFAQVFYGYGNFIGNSRPEAAIRATSYHLTVGVRYKRKISEFYSLGGDIAWVNNTYALKQQDGKRVPDTILHKKERLSWMYFSASVYNRFNFAKRGNVMGTYLDIGAEAGYSFMFTHFYYDRADDGRSIKTRVRGLDYYQPFYYAAFVRVGKDRLALSCSYRLSDLFKPKYNYKELPPLCLSLQLSLY